MSDAGFDIGVRPGGVDTGQGRGNLDTSRLDKVLLSRRIPERPEIGSQEVNSFLDRIGAALGENRFVDAAKVLEEQNYRKGLDSEGKVDLYVHDLVTDRAQTLADAGDGQHLVDCVSHLSNSILSVDLPEDSAALENITNAIKDHVANQFENKYRDDFGKEHDYPYAKLVSYELNKFVDLDLLDRQKLKEMPEFQEGVGQGLLACIKEYNSDYLQFVGLHEELTDSGFEPKGEMQEALQRATLDWVEKDFRELEEKKDASSEEVQASLTWLSSLMDDLHFISDDQVRYHDTLFQNVQAALARLEPYPDDVVDEPMEETIKSLYKRFGKKHTAASNEQSRRRTRPDDRAARRAKAIQQALEAAEKNKGGELTDDEQNKIRARVTARWDRLRLLPRRSQTRGKTK